LESVHEKDRTTVSLFSFGGKQKGPLDMEKQPGRRQGGSRKGRGPIPAKNRSDFTKGRTPWKIETWGLINYLRAPLLSLKEKGLRERTKQGSVEREDTLSRGEGLLCQGKKWNVLAGERTHWG